MRVRYDIGDRVFWSMHYGFHSVFNMQMTGEEL